MDVIIMLDIQQLLSQYPLSVFSGSLTVQPEGIPEPSWSFAELSGMFLRATG
jgi:hypothetical protein